MQKWRNLTDDEVEEELEQMAKEREIVDDSIMPPTNNSFGNSNSNTEEDFDEPKEVEDFTEE